jgi:hypothetical protein
LGNDAGTVAVFQGQPGGILWFKPVKVADTIYLVKDLSHFDQTQLTQTISEPTRAAALEYATTLSSPSTTTTTTSTTTTLKKG